MITFEALDVILRVQNLPGFVAKMRTASASVGAVGRASRSQAAKTSAAVMSAAKKASAGLAMMTAAAGVAGYHQSVEFEKQMTLIQTQAGRSKEDVAKLTPEVLKLADATGQQPVDLAKGLFGLASTGRPLNQLIKDLRVSADGAAVGLADVEDTTNALTGAWLANIEGAGNFEQTMGILNATVGAGNMHMQDLVTAMGTGVLPAAKNFGLSIQDVMSALALLTDEGYGAYGAMAQFATALHFIGSPTEKARKAMKTLGTDWKTVADIMRQEGLPAALGFLKEKLDSFSDDKSVQTDMLSRILPGGRGRVILTLMNQMDRFGQKEDTINRNSGKLAEDVTRTHETAAWKLKHAWAQVSVALIELGDVIRDQGTTAIVFLLGLLRGFLHVLAAIPDAIKAVVKWWNQLAWPIQAIIEYIGILIGVTITYFAVMKGIEIVIALWGALREAIILVRLAMWVLYAENPILLAFAAIVALIIIVITHWKQVKKVARDVWKWIKDHWEILAVVIFGPFSPLIILLIKNFRKVKRAAVDAAHWIKNAWADVKQMFLDVKDAFVDMKNTITDPAGQNSNLKGGGGIFGHLPGMPKILGGATGFDNFPGGIALVGEKGPEIVHLPRGSNVVPNHVSFPKSARPYNNKSASPIAVPAESMRDDRPIHTHVYLDGREITEVVSHRIANKKARR